MFGQEIRKCKRLLREIGAEFKMTLRVLKLYQQNFVNVGQGVQLILTFVTVLLMIRGTNPPKVHSS